MDHGQVDVAAVADEALVESAPGSAPWEAAMAYVRHGVECGRMTVTQGRKP